MGSRWEYLLIDIDIFTIAGVIQLKNFGASYQV